MWRGRVGARGRRPASTKVSAVASESAGAAPSEPRLLLLATGRVGSTQSTFAVRLSKCKCLTIVLCLTITITKKERQATCKMFPDII